MNILYMLDTNICSYIMRKHPIEVLQKMTELVNSHNSIVISAVTYAELKFGAIGKKANPNHGVIVDNFMRCVDMVFPWDRSAVDATVQIRKELSDKGIIIGSNDMAIAGTAISTSSVLITNNTKEFERVPGLEYENWVSGD
ncbi:twitching motility protein PilT [Marinicella pacifica]|uniref:Twitching motility protein PilT n=2 Tax=Marinicella pacifica TaxID=1171543 RepID=A0A917FQ57_9GAMM|nr:type II toxin-antitoxin system VapC family toxin [Marinicella pacifica]GGF94383.1 twitching motility protein PilT [Marinicella pacifica]